MDKLAEEILREKFEDIGQVYYVAKIIEAMQEYHEAKLKEELFAFNSWMCGKQYDGQIPLIGTCIDEYLKQRNNE